jgi:hypothetical protein
MPLQSLMLKDETALQMCLVSDPAHVVPGAKGNHVAKIQKVLMLVDRANILESELRSRTYGSTTANAVIAYKRARNIINRAYQNTADNIVGKMTIARLDADMLDLERRTTDHTDCGGSGADGVPILGVVEKDLVGRRFPRPQNAIVNIIWQETTASESLGGGMELARRLLARAKELLGPHGITISGGDVPAFEKSVPDFENVIPGSPASCFSIRESAERVFPGGVGSLRVIICPFDDKGEAFGVTDGGPLGNVTFPKFCLINVKKENPDRGTLLHEMIHAAKPFFVQHDDNDPQSVYSETKARTFLPGKHAESIADAFYAFRRF